MRGIVAGRLSRSREDAVRASTHVLDMPSANVRPTRRDPIRSPTTEIRGTIDDVQVRIAGSRGAARARGPRRRHDHRVGRGDDTAHDRERPPRLPAAPVASAAPAAGRRGRSTAPTSGARSPPTSASTRAPWHPAAKAAALATIDAAVADGTMTQAAPTGSRHGSRPPTPDGCAMLARADRRSRAARRPRRSAS